MKKEKGIVEKIIDLLSRASIPVRLHRLGPKTYEFKDHVLGLFLKQECKLSYRRTSNLLNDLGHKTPTYSALARMNKRIPPVLWRALLSATIKLSRGFIAAMDAAFFSRTNPSYHYLKRIDRALPVSKPVQATILVNTRTKQCLSMKVRAIRRHDATDRFYLLDHAPPPRVLVADKAYDINNLHQYAKEHGFLSMIPIRKGTHTGFYRHYMERFFKLETYHKRSLVETVISCVKRKCGGNVASHTARGARGGKFGPLLVNNPKINPKKEIFN